MTSFKKKISLTILTFFLTMGYVFFFLSTSVFAQSVNFQIPIPRLEPSIQACSGILCSGIAIYIAAVYKWFVGALSMLAVLFIMIGGLIWLTAMGNTQRITQAKKLIFDSLGGLAIVLGSYLLLFTISPNLASFKGLEIMKINKIDFVAPDPEPYLDGESGEGPGTVDLSGTPPTNIYCPKKGGTKEIQKISLSLKEKVAYRYGGKGGGPEYKLEGTNKNHKPEMRAKLLKYRYFCPPGNLCLDCSGFINYVRRCAGLRDVGNTANIFPTKPINYSKGELLGRAGGSLQPGDLVGNIEGDPGHNFAGHVWMYIGNDTQGNPTFAESSGRGEKGRQQNANPVYSKGTDAFFKGKRFARP